MQMKLIFEASLLDVRVPYWQPLKWVQRLRAETKSPNVVLKIVEDSGHFGDGAQYSMLREKAFEYAFLMEEIASNLGAGNDNIST